MILKIYNKFNSYITIRYKKKDNFNKIKIFDSKFVRTNKINCDIIYKNKEYELSEYFTIENDIPDNNFLEVKLTVIYFQVALH